MQLSFVTEPAALNQALFSITHGLYVITAKRGDKTNGQVLDALMQVTSSPPRVALGVGKRSLTHEMILETQHLVVSVLDRNDPACADVIRRFGFQSGRDVDKFAGFPHETLARGIPYLPSALAVFEATILPLLTVDLVTHSLFVASIERAATRDGGEPLTYNEYRKTMRKKG
jgi:flavin reductase (DIM6/NTAB) family NADH-FMN oxidoreductase RutF